MEVPKCENAPKFEKATEESKDVAFTNASMKKATDLMFETMKDEQKRKEFQTKAKEEQESLARGLLWIAMVQEEEAVAILAERQRRAPFFTQAYNQWQITQTKPQPQHWDNVKILENYLVAASRFKGHAENNSVDKYYFRELWHNLSMGAYFTEICQAIDKIWPSEGLEFRMNVATYFNQRLAEQIA
jgi:hypothetical protein